MADKITLGTRVLMGVVFAVFGLNGLMMFTLGQGFIPMPPPPPSMEVIMGGFMATGYLMTLVKLLEVLAGIMLLTGRFVNLALVLLGPIVVNILGIHLFAEPAGLPMAIIITILYVVTLKSRWRDFRPLLNK